MARNSGKSHRTFPQKKSGNKPSYDQEVRNDEGKFMGWSKEGERPLSMDRMFGILVKERKELADKIISENEKFSKEQAEAEAQKAIEERYGINV